MGKKKIVTVKINKRRRRTFDEWIADAVCYREMYGDLLVPNDYVTPEGNKLGRWIERKRAQYNGVKSISGSLCSDEINALEAIGMVWKLEYRFKWETWIRQVEIYYNTYGHLNVPKEYTNGIYSLGHWLIEQRQKYVAGGLSEEQIADLEKYHVCWELRTPRSWEEWYVIAKEYYAVHGNLRVRADYVTDNGEKLGKWICTQRECYGGRQGKRRLLPGEIVKLEKIGMIWSIAREQEAHWYRMLEYTQKYIAQYHRLPSRTSEKIITENGRNLTNWVCAQQERYHKGLLSAERAAALKEAGIVEIRERKEEKQELSDYTRKILKRKPVMYDRNGTGIRIRKTRIRLRLSSTKAAKDLKIMEKEYRDIEGGVSELSLETAVRIASYYCISLEYLARGR